jgi:hypothetical protein
LRVVECLASEVTWKGSVCSHGESNKQNLRCSRVLVTATARGDLANECLVDGSVADGFHHCQMLQVIVRLEQGIAGEELDENAAYAPDVAREAPSKVEDDLGSTVVSGRDDG